ncbi:MAG: phosphotransacetylase family protein [Dethiobacter sp.]|nr:phosphotransacetylase family protein [Dethiobacter sp.]MBS3900048.1 phosphotransacetylase family protein [Dethiobacter sp.]
MILKSIFIGGESGSGKTVIALGLALKLQQEGLKVGYFKPVDSAKGLHCQRGEDVALLKEVLSLTHEPAVLSPFQTGPHYLSGGQRRGTEALKEKIKTAWQTAKDNFDTILIEGSLSPDTAASMGIDAISLVKLLDAAMLYVIRLENDYDLDKTIFANNHFRLEGLSVLGNIFNNIDRTLIDKTKGIYLSIMEELGNPVLGIIPRKAEIASPTVKQFHDTLGGELLTNEGIGLERIVEEVVVGSMTIESALGYLRRAPNKAVISGGDRSDIALTALETSTSVLILTGGLYPDVGVLTRATEKNVPVILVHYDTFTAIERLHEISHRIHPGDEQGVRIAQENIINYCNWQAILQYLSS